MEVGKSSGAAYAYQAPKSQAAAHQRTNDGDADDRARPAVPTSTLRPVGTTATLGTQLNTTA